MQASPKRKVTNAKKNDEVIVVDDVNENTFNEDAEDAENAAKTAPAGEKGEL